MVNSTKTIENAQEEIRKILRRYQLRWEDVAPDIDETLWQKLMPIARRIRRNLFRKCYPSLYGRSFQKKKT